MFSCRKTRPAPYVYTPEEIAALLDACTDLIRYGRRHLYPVLFGLIAATGLRLGEALGLAWDEVDLDDGILTIPAASPATPGWCRCTRPPLTRCATTSTGSPQLAATASV